ncbi:MAG: T9SS type A sorting domain-containing protein [Bacteroidales bacterium]
MQQLLFFPLPVIHNLAKHIKHSGLLLLFFLFIVLICRDSVAQTVNNYGHADNVMFGSFVSHNTNTPIYHIKFDSLYPKIDTTISSIPTGDNFRFAVYSDKQGNLKLFSDGRRFWNGNYQLIDSVDMPVGLWNIAVPEPNNPDLINVFSLYPYSSSPDSLHYTKVNIAANNGQGSLVTSAQKFANYGFLRGLAITKHANGRDYWLVGKKTASRKFISFRIKPAGAVDTVFSNAGLLPDLFNYAYWGHLKFSPDGKWLSDNMDNQNTRLGIDTLQILNFDPSSGKVNDTGIHYVPCYDQANQTGNPYNIAFSPDSRYAYVYHGDSYDKRFYQYDLNADSQHDFVNSRVFLINYIHPYGSYNKGIIDVAANGKIYNPSSGYNAGLYLNSVEYPDSAGVSCNWQQQSFMINPSLNQSEYSQFPVFCASWLKKPVDFQYTQNCAIEGNQTAEPTLFSFTDTVSKAEWHFGDTLAQGSDTSTNVNAAYIYPEPGQYEVWVKALHEGMWDSINKTITVYSNPQIQLGPDTTISGSDTIVLNAGTGFEHYKWNTGDTTQTLSVYGTQLTQGSHTYWVEVTDTNGCKAKAYRTITYDGVNVEEYQQKQWRVYPNPVKEDLWIEAPQPVKTKIAIKLYNIEGSLLRKKNEIIHKKTHISVKGLNKGVYWLVIIADEDERIRHKVAKY